jgi:ATP-dependent exoDNAse (exonuclease V) beta subunit
MKSLYKEEVLEEELRLMYVAATQARENLIFT